MSGFSRYAAMYEETVRARASATGLSSDCYPSLFGSFKGAYDVLASRAEKVVEQFDKLPEEYKQDPWLFELVVSIENLKAHFETIEQDNLEATGEEKVPA